MNDVLQKEISTLRIDTQPVLERIIDWCNHHRDDSLLTQNDDSESLNKPPEVRDQKNTQAKSK
jgi:hypothetical protein